MPGSRASVFGEAEDFQAALSADGVAGLLVTGRGQFRARMTQVALEGLRLAAVEEQLARIAFVAGARGYGPGGVSDRRRTVTGVGRDRDPPARDHRFRAGATVAHKNRRTFSLGGHSRIGAAARPLRSRGQRNPVRGPLRGAMATVGCGGEGITRPSPGRRPQGRSARGSVHRYRGGTRVGAAIAACADRVSLGKGGRGEGDRPATPILARFEDWLIAEPFLSMPDLCAALGVSDRLLRECCKTHLGMGPRSYRHLRGMQQVHRALRNGNLDGASVSEVARRHGFDALGRFATNYRALYGELPSVTLRRALRRGTGDLSPGRQRVKFS